MKKIYTIIGIIIGVILSMTGVVHALQPILQGYQGGTGYATTTGGNANKYLQVVGTNPLTYGFGTPAGGSGTGNVSTSSVPTIGNLSYWTTSGNTPEKLGSVATTTASCSGTSSCTPFTIIGSTPITITSSGGSGSGTISTSTPAVVPNLLYFTGASTVGNVATGTVSASGGITATAGQSIIGSGLTIGCTTATGSVPGCISAADWTTFNGKQSALSLPLSIANGGTATTTQVTNGVNYFDGTRITSGTVLNFTGSKLGVGTTPIALFETGNVIRFSGGNFASAVYPVSGHGFEVAYSTDLNFLGAAGSGETTFSSYDRDASAWKDVFFAANNINFSTNGSSAMVLLSSGNVGIGNTNPGAKLEVNTTGSGSANLGRFLVPSLASGNTADIYVGKAASAAQSVAYGYSYNSTAANSFGYITNYGDALATGITLRTGGLMGLGTTTELSTLGIQGTTGNNPFTIASSTGTRLVTVNQSGNVGIGTTTPAVALDVKGAIVSEEATTTFSATPTFDWSTSNQIEMTLTNNVTAITFTNGQRGGGYRLILCQDGTGSRTVAGWPASVRWPSATVPTQTATANTCDLYTFTATFATTTALKYLGGYVQAF